MKNSKEFVYNYEQYLLAVKDKERFRRTNEDLEYNSKSLFRCLVKMTSTMPEYGSTTQTLLWIIRRWLSRSMNL